MRSIVLLTAAILMGGVAHAETTSEKLGVNSVLGIAPTTQDFVTEAAQAGAFEIQSSQLALDRGDQMSRTFAQKMIADHQKADAELKDLVKAKGVKVTFPDGVSKAQQSMLDKLKTLQGPDFDTRYRDDQISGHKEAVNLFQRYGQGGDNPDLKAWADKTAPLLQQHLKMAQDLNSSAQR